MPRVGRGIRGRLAAAFSALLLAALGTATLAGPAHADGVTGVYVGAVNGSGGNVKITYQGKERTVPAALLQMRLDADGTTLKTYCIELAVLARNGERYQEVGWDESTLGANAKFINWILRNSFPYLPLEKVAEKSGVTGLTAQEAVMGTQAAIWHYSDGAELVKGENRANVVKLYEYLTGPANEGAANEPNVSLELTPEALAGRAGEKIGPVKLTTTTDKIQVALDGGPDGVRLLDKDGKPVEGNKTTGGDGDEFSVSVPATAEPGEARITAQGRARVDIGRVFRGTSTKKTQTLILAEAQPVQVSDESTVKWDKAPKPAPTAEAKLDCEQGGLVVTVGNNGDAPAEMTVGDQKVTVSPGKTVEVLVPVEEDSDYKVVVKGPEGFEKEFTGVRNCEKDETVAPTPSTTPSETAPPQGDQNGPLPKTGASSPLPLLLGGAAVLLVLGAGILVLVRRRANSS